jgi:glycosyltransferase involved in cell wall biosynthesis
LEPDPGVAAVKDLDAAQLSSPSRVTLRIDEALAAADVAIVIPIHNAAPFLKRSLDSVVGQKAVKACALLVDDGSHDSSACIMREYIRRYPDVFFGFSTMNCGTGPARNLALAEIFKHAPPEVADRLFISFLDADDWLEANALHTLYLAIKKTGSEIAICDHTCHGADGPKLVKGFWGSDVADAADRLRNSNVFTVWGKLFALQLFSGKTFPSLTHEDAALTPLIVRNAYKVAYIPHSLYNYALRTDSKTGCGDFYLKPDILTAIMHLLDAALESKDDLLLSFTMQYYCNILAEYKNKSIDEYGGFEEQNRLLIKRLSNRSVEHFQNHAISLIQTRQST